MHDLLLPRGRSIYHQIMEKLVPLLEKAALSCPIWIRPVPLSRFRPWLMTLCSHLNWPNATCQEKDTHAKIKNLYELLLVSTKSKQKPSFWAGWNQGIVASLHPTRVTSEVSSHFESVLNSKFHSKRKTSLAQLSETNYCGWKKSCTSW